MYLRISHVVLDLIFPTKYFKVFQGLVNFFVAWFLLSITSSLFSLLPPHSMHSVKKKKQTKKKKIIGTHEARWREIVVVYINFIGTGK